MTIKGVAHVCLKAKDLGRTLHFYADVLGMQKLFDFRPNGEVVGFYLKKANDTFIEVFRAGGAGQSDDARILHHFCLETDALEKLHERLAQEDFSPGPIVLGVDNTLQFWAKDPDGLDVEFQEYTPQSSQFTGADVELR